MGDYIDEKDPLWVALPAEVKKLVEEKVASYEDEDEKKRPALAYPLFPEVPEVGEEVVAPPMPPKPPRKLAGPNYCLGSQPDGWVQRSIAQSRRPPPKPPKALPQRPAWNSSPSGRWIEGKILTARD